MNSNVVCLYHDDCPDGLAAAWAVLQRFPEANAIAVRHSAPFPDGLEGKVVYIVDFCYPLNDLITMSVLAAEVHVLDHHKGMDETIAHYNQAMAFLGFDTEAYNGVYDINRSGAKLTWETLLPDYPTPQIIEHISDYDLWRFELDNTEAVYTGLCSYEMSLKSWIRLFHWTPDYDPTDYGSPHAAVVDMLEKDGYPLLRQRNVEIERVIKIAKREIELCGYTVPMVNAPRWLMSDVVAKLATDQPFAVGYYDSVNGRHFSLRSTNTGIDTIPISTHFGGSGHTHASGFTVTRDHPLAQL